jgi:hypothetical protein
LWRRPAHRRAQHSTGGTGPTDPRPDTGRSAGGDRGRSGSRRRPASDPGARQQFPTAVRP